jgi:hypothetical protein
VIVGAILSMFVIVQIATNVPVAIVAVVENFCTSDSPSRRASSWSCCSSLLRSCCARFVAAIRRDSCSSSPGSRKHFDGVHAARARRAHLRDQAGDIDPAAEHALASLLTDARYSVVS